KAALPALIIGSAPFYGRLVEIALKEVHEGGVEAAQAMGANTWTIIFRVLLPASMPALISGITVTAIALIVYTAMDGVIGAGGFRISAYYFDFERQDFDIVLVCSGAIVVIVFIFQCIGDYFSKKIDKR